MSALRRYDTIHCSTELMSELKRLYPYSSKAKLAAEAMRLLIAKAKAEHGINNDAPASAA